MTPGDLEGHPWLYTLSGPSGSCSPGYLIALRDQLLTAPESSVSTKHLASVSANFCICCSRFPASLRFLCRRKNWPGIFCFPPMCRMPDMALSSHSQEALKSQKDIKIRTPFFHEMMTSCLYPWL